MPNKDAPRDTNAPKSDTSQRADNDEKQSKSKPKNPEDDDTSFQNGLVVEEIVEWFYNHFEEPPEKISRYDDSIYELGGPIEENQILFHHFVGKCPHTLISQAAQEIRESRVYYWVPKSQSGFYPRPDIARSRITRERLIASLPELQRQLSSLQTRPDEIGHNQPPEEIGLPPYADEDIKEISRLLETTKDNILLDKPVLSLVGICVSKLADFAEKALKYGAAKIDLAIDEAIKWGIPIAGAYLAFGDNLRNFAESLRIFFGL